MQRTPESEVIAIVRSMVPNAAQIEIVKYLPSGWSNENFKIKVDGQICALRLTADDSKDIETEVRYLKGSYAPDVLAYDKARKYLITHWMDGWVPQDTPLDPRDAALYLQSLHAQVPMGIRTYDARVKTMTMYRSGKATAEDVAMFLEINWKPRAAIACHNDLNPWNLLVTREGIKTLDWEMAGDNDPLYDLCGLTYGQRYSDEQTEECANVYLGQQVDVSYLIDTRISYLCRENAWAMSQVQIGNTRDEVTNQIIISREEMERLYALRRQLRGS